MREPAFKRGTPIVNLRQLSIVSHEEMQDVATRLGIPTIDPGWIAANISIEGAGPVTQLPRGTIIRFASGASCYITELNTPCTFAGRLMNAKADVACDPIKFVKAARGRRGVMAMVYSEGEVAVGDAVEWISFKPELPS